MGRDHGSTPRIKPRPPTAARFERQAAKQSPGLSEEAVRHHGLAHDSCELGEQKAGEHLRAPFSRPAPRRKPAADFLRGKVLQDDAPADLGSSPRSLTALLCLGGLGECGFTQPLITGNLKLVA
jgi:hypothetical protein